MPDVIYVLTNQAMPHLVKIGRTNSTVELRMKSLDTTGVPLPFECFSAWEVADSIAAEKALHIAFGDHRVRDRREFFRISPDKPTAILKVFGIKDVTPKDDVVDDEDPEDDIRALEKARARRPRFTFDMVGVKPGDELKSLFDDTVTCVVVDNSKVEFRGEVMSLSKAALLVAHDHGRNWKSITGSEYWKFDEETLWDLREAEEVSDDD